VTFRVDVRAEADLTEALRWLAVRGRGTAIGRLWVEWVDGLDRVRAAPQLYPPADDAPAGREVRNYLTRRYGYRIVYEVTQTETIVLAFVRARRRPTAWLGRLTP
jgi:plasmid stabilization system protein ParE